MFRIDINGSAELQAILLAVKASERNIKKAIRQQTKKVVDPEWKRSLAEHGNDLVEHKVLVATGTTLISDQNVKLRAATKGRKLRGGLDPKTQYYVAEYGGDRDKKTTYDAKSRKGKTYKVTRHTARQLRPRNKQGYVFGPAVAQMVPRVAALWTQTVVKVMAEALEGKQQG